MRHKLLDKELVNYCGNIYWVVFEIEQLSLKPLNSSKIVIVAKKKKCDLTLVIQVVKMIFKDID